MDTNLPARMKMESLFLLSQSEEILIRAGHLRHKEESFLLQKALVSMDMSCTPDGDRFRTVCFYIRNMLWGRALDLLRIESGEVPTVE